MKRVVFFIAVLVIALAGNIKAQKTPATLPYSCNFSNATERSNWYINNTNDNMRANWAFIHDEYEDDWYLECGVQGGDYGNDPVTVNVTRRFECGYADSIKISFQFSVRGEGNVDIPKAYDYLAAFCEPTDEMGGTIAGQKLQPSWLWESDQYDIRNILYKDNTKDLLHCKLFSPNHSASSNPNWTDIFTTTIANPNPGGTADFYFVWTNDDDYTSRYACWVDNVSITPITDYGIEIAGLKVTSDNCNNITSVDITGSVSYNPNTKTLTLNNAIIEGGIKFSSDIKDITITLTGDNKVSAWIGSTTETKTINGDGSLEVQYIDCEGEIFTIIEDCTIDIDATIEAYRWALYTDADGSKLTIKNANLSAEGYVAIGDFAEIELIGCKIVEPTNAQIIDTKYDRAKGKYICDGDGNIAKKVVIKKLSELNDIAQTNNISIYPNPAQDKVTIEGTGEIVITNNLGQVIKHIKDNNTNRTLNIKDFERGVYYIKVGKTTQKLVVE